MKEGGDRVAEGVVDVTKEKKRERGGRKEGQAEMGLSGKG